jgi:hypothetical protein
MIIVPCSDALEGGPMTLIILCNKASGQYDGTGSLESRVPGRPGVGFRFS